VVYGIFAGLIVGAYLDRRVITLRRKGG
jgi:hypothetical protein